MTLKEFTELLDSHGSDLGKWPDDRRVAAVALLDRSDEAKKAFADACVFDAALRHGDPDTSPARQRQLIDGIMEAIKSRNGTAEAKPVEKPAPGKPQSRAATPPDTPRPDTPSSDTPRSDVASSATCGDIVTAPRRPD